MGAETPRRSHAAQNAIDPRTLSRDELRDYLRSVPTVSVEFAGACMGVSRPAAYRAAAAGDIRGGARWAGSASSCWTTRRPQRFQKPL